MGELQSNLSFRFMSLGFRLRDLRLRRMEILKDVGIQAGFRVLDYGCGAGSYVPAVSEMVGPAGKVYALDIHPLAVESVRRMALKKGLANVETTLSDCRTGLPDDWLDVVLLYDVYHNLGDPEAVLSELHRVLKTDGMLSFNDHHLKHEDVMAGIGAGTLFRLAGRGRMTYRFRKATGQ